MMNKVEMSDEMLEQVIGGSSDSALAKALKRVSSGMKINSACSIIPFSEMTKASKKKASVF